MAAVLPPTAAAQPAAGIGCHRLPRSCRPSTSSSLPSSASEVPRQSSSNLGPRHKKLPKRKRPRHPERQKLAIDIAPVDRWRGDTLETSGTDRKRSNAPSGTANSSASSARRRERGTYPQDPETWHKSDGPFLQQQRRDFERDQATARQLPREYWHLWPQLRVVSNVFMEVHHLRIAMAHVIETIVLRLETASRAQIAHQTAGTSLAPCRPSSGAEPSLVEKRDSLRAYLTRFTTVTTIQVWQLQLVNSLIHDYRLLVRYQHVKSVDCATHSAQLTNLVASSKAQHVSSTLRQLNIDIHLFLTPHVSPFLEPAAFHSGLPPRWVAVLDLHNQRLREFLMWAHATLRIWNDINWHAVRSTLLRRNSLGEPQAFLLTEPLSRFKTLARVTIDTHYRYHQPLKGKRDSRKRQMFSQIESKLKTIIVDLKAYSPMLQDLNDRMFQRVKMVNESGALLPYATHIKAEYLRDYKRRLVESMDEHTSILGPHGYKPSKWLLDCHRSYYQQQGKKTKNNSSVTKVHECMIRHYKKAQAADGTSSRASHEGLKQGSVFEVKEKVITSLGQSTTETALIRDPGPRDRHGPISRHSGLNAESPEPLLTKPAPVPGRIRLTQSPRLRAFQTSMASLETTRYDQQTPILQRMATESPFSVNDGGDDGANKSNGSDVPPREDAEPAAQSLPSNCTQTQSSPNTKDIDMSGSEHSSDSEHENGDSGEGEDCEDLQPHHVPLAYQIPEAVLRAAMSASPNSAGSFFDQALYRGPQNEKISVHYCETMEIGERVAKYFLREKVLGFDIEWVPWSNSSSIKDNVSLVQLACENRIALLHLARFKGSTAQELLPPTVRTIIESPDICKVGVAIKGDFSRVEKYLGVKAMGVFELSRLHNLVEHSETNPKQAGSKKLFSLAKQVNQHLQLPLSKGPVRESDWSQRLTVEQIKYAATDAYAGLRIFDVLQAKRKMLIPVPPIPALCDFDRPPRPKPAAKPALVTVEEEVTEGAMAETTEHKVSESEEFETAAEELEIDGDLEQSASDSDSGCESSDLDADPNADYVPSAGRTGNVSMDAQNSGDTSAEPQSQRRRVGRVNWTVLSGPDPMYPNLPVSPSSEDSEDAFDPPVSRSKRKTNKDRSLRDEDVEMKDGSPDENLEQQLFLLEIGDEADNEAEPQPTLLVEAADEADVTFPSSKRGRVIIKNQEGDWVFEPSSSARKDKKAKRAKKVSSSPPKEEPDEEPKHPATATQPPPPPKLTPTFTPLAPDTSSKTPEYNAADAWAQNYLYATIPSPSTTSTSTAPPSRVRVTLPPLRAYHMWYHQTLTLDAVAGHLRDPPLATSTVASYIVQAVAMEKLEYENDGDKERFREVLRGLPLGVRMTRWKWLVQKVGGV